MARFVVVQHVGAEGPGLIATIARQRGLALDVRRMDLGEELPATASLAGLIVLGGPMDVADAAAHPHLLAEQRLLAAAAAAHLPVLGICLGAQLLAAALGARVFTGPAEEVGFGDVTITDEGRDDPLLGPAGAKLPAFHWHHDTFDLPAGAVHLARTRAYPHQAFRAGARAWGLQFHVEVDQALTHEWSEMLPRDKRVTEPQRAAIEKAGRGILNRFFELARRPT